MARLRGEPFDGGRSTTPGVDEGTLVSDHRDPASDQLERNKRLVEEFFEKVPHGPVENLHLIDQFVAEDYIQHNPEAKQGREGLREFFTYILSLPLDERLDPSKTIEVNLVAERDFVMRQEIRTDGMLIDLFRIKDGLLYEHWDAFRPAPGVERIFGL